MRMMMGLLCLGCLLLGFGVMSNPVDAKPLAYRSEFDFADAEGQEVRRFLAGLNQSCRRGDGPGLLAGLSIAYREALAEQLRRVGRDLSPATLREMQSLVRLPESTNFVMGRSRGDHIAIVLVEPSLQFKLEAVGRDCLTCIPLRWDGHGFRLGKPVLRHAPRPTVAAVAAAMCAEAMPSAGVPAGPPGSG